MLAQSRVHYPHLQVFPLSGWHDPEGHPWCWTAKQFAMQVVLPLEQVFSGFRLKFFLPQAVLDSNAGTLALSCNIDGQLCGSLMYSRAGDHEITGSFPPSALHQPILRIDFHVAGTFSGDARDLGICIPLCNGIPLEIT